jgi:hypothetical protein
MCLVKYRLFAILNLQAHTVNKDIPVLAPLGYSVGYETSSSSSSDL